MVVRRVTSLTVALTLGRAVPYASLTSNGTSTSGSRPSTPPTTASNSRACMPHKSIDLARPGGGDARRGSVTEAVSLRGRRAAAQAGLVRWLRGPHRIWTGQRLRVKPTGRVDCNQPEFTRTAVDEAVGLARGADDDV